MVSWSPLACGIITGKYENGIPESSRAAMKVQPIQLYNIIRLFLPNFAGGNSNQFIFTAALAIPVAEGENNE